jgi:fumarate hydratase, class II
VKYACGVANRDLGKLTGSRQEPAQRRAGRALLAACREVAEGKLRRRVSDRRLPDRLGHLEQHEHANEVIANRAIELLGGDRFEKEKPIHPNDHVNMGQSTNDIFPTAIHVAVALRIKNDLIPALSGFATCWPQKAAEWDRSSRSAARTWPTPRRCAWGRSSAASPGNWSCRSSGPSGRSQAMLELPAGGTAVGTGINTHPEFGRRVAEVLAARRAFRLSKRSTTSRPTPSATAWSSATASCARSP